MNFISRLRIFDSIYKSLRLYCGIAVVVFMAKNDKSGSRSKHIKYLAKIERIKDKKVVIDHISNEVMLADLKACHHRN